MQTFRGNYVTNYFFNSQPVDVIQRHWSYLETFTIGRKRSFRSTLKASPKKQQKSKEPTTNQNVGFQKELRLGSMFRENIGQEESENMDDLTTQAQSYINYEDNVLAKDIERNKAFRNKKTRKQQGS